MANQDESRMCGNCRYADFDMSEYVFYCNNSESESYRRTIDYYDDCVDHEYEEA